MSPTPEFHKGDRVEVPHRQCEGQVTERWYSEGNDSWIYRVILQTDGITTGIYQGKNLEQ